MNKTLRKVLFIVLLTTSIYLCFIGYKQYEYNQGYAKSLIRAIQAFDDETLDKLLDNPKNIDSTPRKLAIFILDDDNRNPLQEAAYVGNYYAVVALIEAGANVNFINPITNFTPLLSTLISNKPNRILIANYLIDSGADVHHSPNKGGFGNALGESIGYYGLEMEESYTLFLRLINLGCDPYVRVNPNNIFLKSAMVRNKLVMVYLLENDIFDVNVVNDDGYSALMFLARFRIEEINIEMVNILLSYGADKTLKNEDGMTAYDFALETGNAELIELLSI